MRQTQSQTLDDRRQKLTAKNPLFSPFTSPFSLLTSTFLLLTSLLGCGYHLAGSGVDLPPEAKTIAVPTMQNLTFEPALESVVTKYIREEFLSASRLKLIQSAGEADLLLKGTILNFNLIPISFDRDRSVVLEYRVKIDVDVRLEESASSKIIWEDPFFESTAEFFVREDTSTTRVAQDRAIAEASKHLAENLISRVLEGQRR